MLVLLEEVLLEEVEVLLEEVLLEVLLEEVLLFGKVEDVDVLMDSFFSLEFTHLTRTEKARLKVNKDLAPYRGKITVKIIDILN